MTGIENSQIKILLTDDTPANLEIAGRVLEKEGYDLYIADSGFTALELSSETEFDLILLDIMMPEMDGFETCRRIRESEENRGIPIIFLTAKADIESVVKGFELGAVDYIRKPFNSLELKARVKNHVELKKIREELERKNIRLQEAYERLGVLARTDPLTGLLNRREVLERMEYEMVKHERNKRPFSIIIGDIDFFKQVNDTYGHQFGDQVLISIAELLRQSCRKQDSVSRWGGEEFLLLLPDTDEQGSAVLAEKLRLAVQQTAFQCGGADVKVTITFGVSSFKPLQSVDDLISGADRALYQGKKEGRNCVCSASSEDQ